MVILKKYKIEHLKIPNKNSNKILQMRLLP